MLTQDFPPAVGGIETYSWELARRWVDALEHVVVLAPRQRDAARFDARAPFPVVRTRIPCDLLSVSARAAVMPIVRRHRIDAVFSAQWQPTPSLLGLRSSGQIPRLFVAAHGRELLFAPFAAAAPIQNACDRLRSRVLREADALFPVSRFTADLISRVGGERDRVFVVGNGTDPQRFTPGDGASFRRAYDLEGLPILLTVGRLVARKGIDDVLRALPRLLERHPDLVYVIVGDGPDRGRLEGVVAEHGLRGAVRFLGRLDDDAVVEAFRACDVFVTASRRQGADVEGFGIVFLEANACERPVVGTRSGGIPDAIIDGETGLLVPEGDPAALADALVRLFDDPALRRALGRAGRARVLREASWDVTATRILERMRALAIN
ncbi:MAG: glycosyltransferase family 4 protein [Nannocystaceae bacterium]